tara:strand:- start:502 stop:2067 length:1566 start_codon:yes stop_codon:yes gene_type:complete
MSRLKTDAIRNVNASVDGINLDTSGNVGLGTTSPNTNLHVEGTGTVAEFKSTNNNYLLQLKGNNSANYVYLGTNSSNDYLIANNTNGSGFAERLRITSDGRVGIGTSTPYAFDTTTTVLEVKGAVGSASDVEIVRFRGGQDANGGTAVLRLTNDNDRGLILKGGRESDAEFAELGTSSYNGSYNRAIRITHDGKIGIGTTSPDKSLTIGGSTPVIKLNDGNGRLVEIRGGSTSYDPSILSMYAANLYLGAGSTLMSSFSSDGQIKVKRHNSASNSNYIDISAVKGSYWGYSGHGYTGLLVGSPTVAFSSTIFMGVDITGNTNGAFTGDGREIVFRNNINFVVPNAANNGYLNPISLNKGATTEGVPRFKQGLLFNTDTADANILHDYEEGTYTPVITCAGGGGYNLSGSYNTLAYRKIGSFVHIQGYIAVTSESGTPSGVLRITLPKTAAALAQNADYTGIKILIRNHGSSNIYNQVAVTHGSGSYFNVLFDDGNGASTYFTHSYVDTDWQFFISGGYIAT